MLIRDRGTGLSEEVARRIGEPFFTTKESGKRNGAGSLFDAKMSSKASVERFTLSKRQGGGLFAKWTFRVATDFYRKKTDILLPQLNGSYFCGE